MELFFQRELSELIKLGTFTEERKIRYEKWVSNADRARSTGSLDATMNQYDKAEEILTWYTFALLLRMTTEQRISTINEILKPSVGSNVVISRPYLTFDKMLPPPKSYFNSISIEHPVKYIREEIERHRKNGLPLETHTHIDVLIETNELIIPIEAKFTSDIDYQRTYNCIRNQIARTIDVSIEVAKKVKPSKKVIFLLCVPRYLYNKGRYYYFKMKDYENLENLKQDLPHQAESIKACFDSMHVVFWEDIASTIIGNAVEWNLLDIKELDALKDFYNERLIQLALKSNAWDKSIWNKILEFAKKSIDKPLYVLNPSRRAEFRIIETSKDFIRVNKLPIKLPLEMFLSVYNHLRERCGWVLIGARRMNAKPDTIEGFLKINFFGGNMSALSTATWISAILVKAGIGVEFNNKARGQALRYITST